MRVIGRNEVQEAVASGGAVIVEALPEAHWAKEHIPGALNLPHDDVDSRAASLLPDKDAPVIVYCSNTTCQNSRIAARRLEELGYTDVSAYEAGKEDWIGAGLPTESAVAA